ncbi:MAG: hypothetical protein ABJE47_09950 [bacterium]
MAPIPRASNAPSAARRVSTYLVAPRKRHRRSWAQRHLVFGRGRFDLAIIGGGAIALLLATLLPGMPSASSLTLLVVAGCAITVMDAIVGIVPSLVVTIFAPLVVALTDPMWTLGETLGDFTLGRESLATFGVFAIAALAGMGIRHWYRGRPPA